MLHFTLNCRKTQSIRKVATAEYHSSVPHEKNTLKKIRFVALQKPFFAWNLTTFWARLSTVQLHISNIHGSLFSVFRNNVDIFLLTSNFLLKLNVSVDISKNKTEHIYATYTLQSDTPVLTKNC